MSFLAFVTIREKGEIMCRGSNQLLSCFELFLHSRVCDELVVAPGESPPAHPPRPLSGALR